MLRSMVFLPSTPLLVPGLSGRDPAGADLRAAVLGAVRAAPPWRWAVGTDDDDATLDAGVRGTFLGFGVDVPVWLGPRTERAAPVRSLPLAGLIAAWVRGATAPDSSITVGITASGSTPTRCAERGTRLRTELDRGAQPEGLLVVGDGCTTLDDRAPGAFDARAAGLQAIIDRALAYVDVAALAALDPRLCHELGVSGRVPWQVAGAAAAPGWDAGSEWNAEVHYSGAPHGVGYTVVTWSR